MSAARPQDFRKGGTLPARGLRPAVYRGRPITEYSHAQLRAIVRWVESDTLLRTRDQLVDEVMHELGFHRHGKRIVKGAAAQTHGLTQKATHLKEEPKPQPDDVTLARKVETEIFREPDVPKGKINVNAENGKIVLRGEVDSAELIDDLVSKAHKVQGVEEVESLLHTPGKAS